MSHYHYQALQIHIPQIRDFLLQTCSSQDNLCQKLWYFSTINRMLFCNKIKFPLPMPRQTQHCLVTQEGEREWVLTKVSIQSEFHLD